ncbi:hypothetical protein [Streptomonospora wellingtoniae]|uniref:PQQ-binding-like beta-propeller repeat protein n=1 Tax=Streptomonospora wellingtoniae TaxID=3075544 RepID=A0ABU2KYQ0_9ACTN|nr:hypothetical protein [Streptomonospora sp. DSM 45055]MDT0304441.1 hypothetical protein [Streptomonospora sp. DSM 45055]
MRTWRRAPLAAAAGVALLVAGTACTGEDEPDRPDDSPRPLPTAFEGELPPGVGGEPLRHLHGPGAEGPSVLDDEMGVRISSVGDAFLISSNSEEHHVLLGAEDGETLWQGERHIQRYGSDSDGSPVLVVEGRDGGTRIIGDDGETLWQGSGGRDTFVGGSVVRRPAGWSADEPYGDYTVSIPGEGELWEYTFAAPPEGGGDGAGSGNADDSAEDQTSAAPDPDRNGVPVASRDGVLLLDDGAGLLQARGITDDDAGGLLWSIAGDDPELAGGTDVQRPRPQVVGDYEIPAEQGGEGGTEEPPDEGSPDAPSPPEGDGSPSPSGSAPADGGAETGGAAPEDETGEAPMRTAVLVRWTVPEEPSVLSLHDLHTGELLWSLSEPGANPSSDEFAPPPLPGALYEPRTGTVLLPQATGETPLIAVDLAAGEIRWRFEDEFEQSISPALAMGGYVYGDAGGGDGSGVQVVLDAMDKDVVAEGLGAYVEAVTREGYSIVVSDRQRFVFPPPEGPGAEDTGPTG